MKLLIINACAYCGKKAEGNFSMTRDGTEGPDLPLCDACGGSEVPTLHEIWWRISLVDDDGHEYGPTVHLCDLPQEARS